ncbi:MAG: fluoride efflux transporter FluC [Acidimicrobiia bacterium]
MIPLLVALAGALGAPARYLVERAVSERRGHGFPWGTLAVNLLGCLLLGALTGAVEFHGWSLDPKTVLGVGFLGAFTTFSAFAVEADRLPSRLATAYVAASLLGGLAAAGIGLALASV